MNRRPVAEGRPVAERVIRQVRLLAVVVLALLVAAGRRPTAEEWVVPSLAVVAGVVLAVAIAVCGPVLVRRRPHRRAALALLGTVADGLVVLGVVCLAGFPPRSLAVVLLVLPLLEAALWSGLAGLGCAWIAATVSLVGYAVATGGPRLAEEVTALLVALAILLLATLPMAVLAEHLVAEVSRLQRARRVADERAALLGDLSGVTAELFPLQLGAVARALATGAHRLGASAAAVDTPDGAARLASAGAPAALARINAEADKNPEADKNTEVDESTEPTADERGRAARTQQRTPTGSLLLSWPLPVVDGHGYVLRAVVEGEAERVARRIEALDLLAAQGRAALVNAALVEQLTRLKHTYEELATRDQLTGLANRRGLLAGAASTTGRIGVLFCDLDGFKAVNDTFGHAAGDELLRQVARRLESVVGSAGSVGRVGGDEFVVVLPDADDTALTLLAGRLEDLVSAPYVLAAGPVCVGVSVGTGHSAPGRGGLDEVLDHADRVMYAVKRTRTTALRRTVQTGPGTAVLEGSP